ncbi:uncharacterized protein LTR77_010821 [Saxophila tyrrhenica]|uniref:Uncharacterized protein n=1 Tax=Saxophila tyrrhenica TaxID=1690608 RepID=A0AAV9NUH4_9PEZI|nr:hypothetical protein LTR77_010821 [Saxophila tyrrhenica]
MASSEQGSWFKRLEAAMAQREPQKQALIDDYYRQSANDDEQHQQAVEALVARQDSLHEKRKADRERRHQEELTELQAKVDADVEQIILHPDGVLPAVDAIDISAQTQSSHQASSETRNSEAAHAPINHQPDISFDYTNIPLFKLKLKARYGNFYEDEGGIYALCCCHCGANISCRAVKDGETDFPNMDRHALRAHIIVSHKVKGLTVTDVEILCRGEPIPDAELLSIWLGRPTRFDDRVKVSTGHRSGAPTKSDEVLLVTPTPRRAAFERANSFMTSGDTISNPVSCTDVERGRTDARSSHSAVLRSGSSGLRGRLPEARGSSKRAPRNLTSSRFTSAIPKRTSPEHEQPLAHVKEMFNELQKQFQNLHMDDGKVYALCGFRCGANTGNLRLKASGPSFDAKRLWLHLHQVHPEDWSVMDVKEAIQRSKGRALSYADLERISKQGISKTDERLQVKRHVRIPTHRATSSSDDEPMPSPHTDSSMLAADNPAAVHSIPLDTRATTSVFGRDIHNLFRSPTQPPQATASSTLAHSATAIQDMFDALKGEYLNLMQDCQTGKMYALCCILCGANTAQTAHTNRPGFTALGLRNHYCKADPDASQLDLLFDEFIQQCRGPAISSKDIVSIRHGQLSALSHTIRDRISVRRCARKRIISIESEEGTVSSTLDVF